MKPRIIGKKSKKKTEVFVKVMSKVYLEALIKSNIGLLNEEKLSLQIKKIKLEYMVKIRMLLGPNLKFASKENYENDIYKKLKYNN